MTKRIVVSGMGMISAIVDNLRACKSSLVHHTSGLREIEFFKSMHQGKIPVCSVPHSNDALEEMAACISGRKHTRTSLLAMVAVQEAIKDAKLQPQEIQESALISATTVGGMDKTEDFFIELSTQQKSTHLRDVIGHDCADSTEAIADLIGCRGIITTVSTACSSSINSIILGSRLIQNGLTTRAIVGGTDSLTRFTVNGFNSLMILDKQHCKPFDKNRNGLNIGEGAAFLVLETEEAAIRQNKKIYAYVKGYANTCDAFHQTASSPEGDGAYLAMKEALEMASLPAEQIDYINVHGTGTANNDLTEGIAMHRIFGSEIPPFSSTKAYTGHTLGATGAIEAVISIVSLQQNLMFPNLNFSTPIEETGLIPIHPSAVSKPLQYVLSNSFGFGGNNSSIIFSKF